MAKLKQYLIPTLNKGFHYVEAKIESKMWEEFEKLSDEVDTECSQPIICVTNGTYYHEVDSKWLPIKELKVFNW